MNRSWIALMAIQMIATLAYGRAIQYSVVSLVETGHKMGVMVDDTTYPLTALPETPIVYTGVAPVAKNGYFYAKIDAAGITEKEAFQRSPVTQDTPNEFYNRTWNSKSISKLPQLLEPLPIINRIDSSLHMEGQVPTFYFSGSASDIRSLHTDVRKDIQLTMNMSYVGLNGIQTFSGVKLKLSGHSSRWFPKLSYNVKLPKDRDLFGYRRLKLRSLAVDPSYIREQLTFDIVKSAGLPSTGYSYARVIINDRAYGLFGLVEAYKDSWQRNEFSNGEEQYKRGITYQARGFMADLSYFNNQSLFAQYYKIKEDPDKDQGPADYQKLIDLTKFVQDAPTSGDSAARAWESHFNMECLVRNLVLEAGLDMADGYIVYSNNYHLYDSPEEQRFLFLPYDLDMSLGTSYLRYTTMWDGDYTRMLGFSRQPLTTKALNIPVYKERFEHLLLQLVDKMLNLEVMGPRINDLIAMLGEDIAWDQTLPRASTGDAHPPEWVPRPTRPDLNEAGDFDEFMARTMQESIPLKAALDGPTGWETVAGLKEWIVHKSESTRQYLLQKGVAKEN